MTCLVFSQVAAPSLCGADQFSQELHITVCIPSPELSGAIEHSGLQCCFLEGNQFPMVLLKRI